VREKGGNIRGKKVSILGGTKERERYAEKNEGLE